jgi:hypothetical protein
MLQYNHTSYTSRNNYIKQYNLDNKSIIDFGCGTKDVLNYIFPKEYLGIDIVSTADLIYDLDTLTFKTEAHYDVALMLGLLEWMKNPFEFVNSVKTVADRFIILFLFKDQKKQKWKQSFNQIDVTNKLNNIFNFVEIKKYEQWSVYECKDVRL